MLRSVLLILLSALSYAVLFPPWNLSALAWLALVPLLLALRSQTWQRRAALGLLWGFVANFAVGHWVPVAITFYYDQPWWFGPLFCAVASLFFWAPYYAVFAALCELRPGGWGTARCCVVAALWVAAELGRSRLLTGAPWLPLGYALAPYPPLIQAADMGGVYLLSFVVVVVNAAVASGLARYLDDRSTVSQSTWWQPLAAATGLVTLLVGYGAWRLLQPLPSQPRVPTAIVQGNNQEGAYWRPGAYGKGLERYLEMSAQALNEEDAEVIIWPEAAVTMFLGREPRLQAEIAATLRRNDADLLVGAPHFIDTDPALPTFLNSAFYLRSDGTVSGRYDKTHLLPFVEYFPLRIDFLRRRFERVRSFTPGTQSLLLDTRYGPTAVVICFEGIFPELVGSFMQRGAQMLVVLSNDVWLGRGAGPEQHLSMVQLRAVENRTWVARATTTGISAVIDPYGRIVARSPVFAPAVLRADIVPMRLDTIYERIGDAFAYGCLFVSVAVLSLALIRRYR